MIKFSLYNDTIQGEFDPKDHVYTINSRRVYNITTILELCPHDHLNFWRISVYKKYLTNFITKLNGKEKGLACHDFLWAKKKDKIDKAREILYEGSVPLMNLLELVSLFKEIHSAPTVESKEALQIGNDVHRYCERYGLWKLGKGRKPRRIAREECKNAITAFHNWLDDYEVEFIHTEIIVYSLLNDYIGTADLVCKIDGKLFIIDYKTSKGLYIPYMAQAKGLADAYFEEHKEYPEPALLRLPKDGAPYEFKVPELPDSLDINLLLGCHTATKSYYEIEELTK